ncbi:MAG: putative glycoside hydrolase [Patescibacteria group bacterium]
MSKKLIVLGLAGAFLTSALLLKSRYNFSADLELKKLIAKVSPSPIPQRLNPVPKTVKAVYLTSWSAGNPEKINQVIELAKTTEINAVVIDIKDYSGKVAFETNSELIKQIGSKEIRIKNFKELIQKLHQENIYIIARIAVFQDLYLAETKPELAVKNKTNSKIWRDQKNLAWVDPASRKVWDYNLEIAKQAIALGVDELNFDYIRFPSDGDISNLAYPVYNPETETKFETIKRFFKYLNESLKPEGIILSADLFGQATFDESDMNIGQIIEDAYLYFDYVSPMVYPSHYANGFLGYKNPALYPYEVIDYSLESAIQRRVELFSRLASGTTELEQKKIKLAELRPWLQAFNLGADYTPEIVRKQIQAIDDNGLDFGWYLWNPNNIYNPKALKKE